MIDTSVCAGCVRCKAIRRQTVLCSDAFESHYAMTQHGNRLPHYCVRKLEHLMALQRMKDAG